MPLKNVSQETKRCIELCWDCRTECEQMLYTHCLEKGGDHLEPRHVRLMADCIQICQTSADAMTRGSDMHAYICAACAEICDACADSCEQLKDDKMKDCVDLCRRCAEECRKMGEPARKRAA